MKQIPPEFASRLPEWASENEYQPCPNCGSRDNLQFRWPGRRGATSFFAICWGCGWRWWPAMRQEGYAATTKAPKEDAEALAKLANLRRERPDRFYAKQPGAASAWLKQRGVEASTCARFNLGLHKAGLTIPVYDMAGDLCSVVLRLFQADEGGKYRRLVSDLPPAPAWWNRTEEGILLLVEGPIKAITVSQYLKHEWPVIGLHTLRMDAVARSEIVAHWPLVFYFPDPLTAFAQGALVRQNVLDLEAGGCSVRLHSPLQKIDDLIVNFGRGIFSLT